MSKPKNAIEIFHLLEKTNCRQCGEKTCLAFAGAVFLGRRKMAECPHLPRDILDQFAEGSDGFNKTPPEAEIYLNQLKAEVAHLDLSQAASRTGGNFTRQQLTLKVLGKDFSVDQQGNLSSEIHVTPWVAVPFLNYIIRGAGLPVSGKWVTFRELKGGMPRHLFFQKRCEAAMKQVADVYTDLFDDLVHLFNGRQVAQQFQSDISVVLYPLPKVPMMICYWLPGDGMDSSLHLFFDQTADRNLDIDSVFNLGTGLAAMFAKIALRHGYGSQIN